MWCLTSYHSLGYLHLRKILFYYKNCYYFYFVVVRDDKLCHKETKTLSEKRQILKDGFLQERPPQLRTYLLATNLTKKKKKETNSVSPLHPPRPPKLKRNPRQPRSQGSLPPALWSARENLGTGLKPRKMYFLSFTTLDARVIKTNFKAMKKKKKKILAIFFTSTQPCQDQNKNRIQECWFFFGLLLM